MSKLPVGKTILHPGPSRNPPKMTTIEEKDEIDTDLRNEKNPQWRKRILEHLLQQKRFNEIEIRKQENAKREKQLALGIATEPATAPPHVSAPIRKSSSSRRRIDRLAEPKMRICETTVVSDPFGVRPSALIGNASNRIHDLAMPKRVHVRPLGKKDTHTQSVANPLLHNHRAPDKEPFQISDRLKSLAKPKRNVYEDPKVRVSEYPTSAMAKFTNTSEQVGQSEIRANRMARLLELTKIPRHKLLTPEEKKPGVVPYAALVCRPSPRVEELAGPKIRRVLRENEYAFKTKPSALRYNPSTRIESLAVAKIRTKDTNI